MKVELHLNGSIQIEMYPENEIERVTLMEMLARTTRGQSAKFESIPDSDGARLSVEK